jgi:ubiquinone/menaquinone biosynthesis C-methylase UbiE
MKDNKRIKKERKYWDKFSSKFDKRKKKEWKVYESLLFNKIADNLDKGNTVLEVACGTGRVTLEISKQANKVYAIDISSQMIDVARKNIKEKEINNIELSVEDAYNLPFDNEMFDTVICINSLHNMIYPENALSEIKRVLKPEGRFISTVTGIGSRKFKIIMSIFKFLTNFPVFHKLNLEEFADMLSKAGFSIEKKEILKHPQDILPLLYAVSKN